MVHAVKPSLNARFVALIVLNIENLNLQKVQVHRRIHVHLIRMDLAAVVIN
jgi:hypothetical protein